MAINQFQDDFDDSTELLTIENWLKSLTHLSNENNYITTIPTHRKQRINSKKNLKEEKSNFLKSPENKQNTHILHIFQNFQNEIDNLTQRVNEADTLITRIYDTLSQQPSITTFISELKGKFKAQMVKQQQSQIKRIFELENEIENVRQNEVKANDITEKTKISMKDMENKIKEEMDFIISQHDQEWQKLLSERNESELTQIQVFNEKIEKLKEEKEFAELSQKSLEEAYEKLRAEKQQNTDAQTSLIQTLRDEIQRLSQLSKHTHKPPEISNDERIVQASEQFIQVHTKRVEMLEAKLNEKNQQIESLQNMWEKQKQDLLNVIEKLQFSNKTFENEISELNKTIENLNNQVLIKNNNQLEKQQDMTNYAHTHTNEDIKTNKIDELTEEYDKINTHTSTHTHTIETKNKEIINLQHKIDELEENNKVLEFQLHTAQNPKLNHTGNDTVHPYHIQEIIASQRQRLITELHEVEANRDEWKSIAEQEHSQSIRLQNDNVSLIEKIRYLETLSAQKDTHTHTQTTNQPMQATPSTQHLIRRHREQSQSNPYSLTPNYNTPTHSFNKSNIYNTTTSAHTPQQPSILTHYEDVYENQLNEQIGIFDDSPFNVFTSNTSSSPPTRGGGIFVARSQFQYSIQKWLRSIMVALNISFGRANVYRQYTPLPINSNIKYTQDVDTPLPIHDRPTLQNFRTHEKMKKLHTLNFAERNVIVWGSLCMSSRPMRLIVFIYTLILHLIFIIFLFRLFD